MLESGYFFNMNWVVFYESESFHDLSTTFLYTRYGVILNEVKDLSTQSEASELSTYCLIPHRFALGT